MKIGSAIIFLLLLTSCASKEPLREVASFKVLSENKEVDLTKSLVNIYPATVADNGLWYFFYIQLKNSDGRYVDANLEDFVLKNDKGEKVDFKLDRVLTGRYYITIEKTADINSTKLNFFIKNKPLKEKLKLQMSTPSLANSKLVLVHDSNYRAVFRLKLADLQNKAVELPEMPEIIIDGTATIEDLKHVGEGAWEFTVVYSDENTILYFSVRAMGTYFNKILRYQHVEK